MTLTDYAELSKRLLEIIKVPAEDIESALNKITKEDVLRICKNEKESEKD